MSVNFERWRVLDRKRNTPAHLVGYDYQGVVATACNWVPSRQGVLVSRAEMLQQGAFVCHCCAVKALAR